MKPYTAKSELMEQVFTCNETWIFQYDPEIVDPCTVRSLLRQGVKTIE